MRFMYGGRKGKTGLQEGRDLRELHKHFKGVQPDGIRYSALKPKTFRVVPDTFLDAVIRFREAMQAPLSVAEQHQLFDEYIELCLLFGIPESELEESFETFREYYDSLLLDTMTYNETVAYLLEEMMKNGPVIPWSPVPQRWWQWLYRKTLYPVIRIFTLGFIDPRFRAKHNIDWSEDDEKTYRCYLSVVRFCRQVIPRWLRYHPMSLYVMAGGHGNRLNSIDRLQHHREE